jgi:transposase
MAVKHVAQYFGLGWDRVKGIDKGLFRRQLGKVDLEGVQILALDEFAIQKDHCYATVRGIKISESIWQRSSGTGH